MQLVSVIVPIYNVEKYLNECVSSIVNQTYRELEIILIDDGSSDRSADLCDEWKEKDNRIIVIHQENGGLSRARNTGINLANGDYFAFVDSDDYVERTFIEKLITIMEKDNSEIAMCNLYGVFQSEITFDGKNRIREDDNVTTIDFLKKMYTYPGFYIIVCNKMFKKSIAKHICFPEGTLHEDGFVMRSIILQANRISVIAEPLYYYRRHNSSITSKRNSERVLQDLRWIQEDINYYEKEKGEDSIGFYVSKLLCNKILHYYSVLDKEQRAFYKKLYKNHMKRVINYAGFSLKCKMKYILGFINAPAYLMIERMYKRKRAKRELCS